MDEEKETEITEEEIVDDEEEEEEIDPNELRQLLMDAIYSNINIEEAIAMKQFKDMVMEDSFYKMRKNCDVIRLFGKVVILKNNFTKIKLYFAKLFSFITNNGLNELIDGLMEEMDKVNSDLKDLNKLTKQIRKASKQLEKNQLAMFNDRLYELLNLIHERQKLSLKYLTDYTQKCYLAVKGINYVESNKNQEALEESSKQIDTSAKALGLRKSFSDQ